MTHSTAMDIDINDLASEDFQSSVTEKAKYIKEAFTECVGNSTSVAGSTSGSLNSDYMNGSNSDTSFHDDGNNDDGDNVSDYDYDDDDDDDYMFDDDEGIYDYLSMQAQFDKADLPPGIEAPICWLDCTPSENVPTAMNTSALSDALANSKNKAAASSSSTISAELCSNGKEEEEKEDEVMRNFQHFKRFDTVDDFSDHHYNDEGFQGQQPPKTWTKKIQDEWIILEKDLPDTIYVRVSEKRMDLLRAVIIGPAGTPYHDGLFVFDVLFPPTYPDIPPMVYYYSGGLRLNPNLYACGKVCLSLLNTWSGKGNEKWMPKASTLLQVLVSIQALILNAKPFFSEPGFEITYGGAKGEKKSKGYNENVFILSLKTMMYTLRRPPKHFDDLVAGHFRSRARDILSACRAYMDGAEVGSVVNGMVEDGSALNDLRAAVAKMMNGLVSNFIRNGSKDCEEFRLPG